MEKNQGLASAGVGNFLGAVSCTGATKMDPLSYTCPPVNVKSAKAQTLPTEADRREAKVGLASHSRPEGGEGWAQSSGEECGVPHTACGARQVERWGD